MFIFILIFVCVPVEAAITCRYEPLMACLSGWKITAADDLAVVINSSLISEVCSGDVSISEMEACVKRSVPEYCKAILYVWRTKRDPYQFICDNIEEYGRLESCRTDPERIAEMRVCVALFPKTSDKLCRPLQRYRTCLQDVFQGKCDKPFFEKLFHKIFDPSIYWTCTNENEDIITPLDYIDDNNTPVEESSWRTNHDTTNDPNRFDGNNDVPSPESNSFNEKQNANGGTNSVELDERMGNIQVNVYTKNAKNGNHYSMHIGVYQQNGGRVIHSSVSNVLMYILSFLVMFRW